jgi:hypothetical protein
MVSNERIVIRFTGGPMDGQIFDSESDTSAINYYAMSRNGTIGHQFKLASPKQIEDLRSLKLNEKGELNEVPSSLDVPWLRYEVKSKSAMAEKIVVELVFVAHG